MNKKKILIFLVFFEIVVISSSSILVAQAWNNANASKEFDVYDIVRLNEWWVTHYGTHDWIAEAALDAIHLKAFADEKWKDGEGNSFWTERRKIIFLIGTEAPDMPKVPSPTSPNVYLKIRLDNVEVSGWGSLTEKRYHTLDFQPFDLLEDDFMLLKNYKPIMDRINKYEALAMKYLKEEKCDLAAFYMGAVMHYISDLGSFFHVLNFDEDIYNKIYNPEDLNNKEHQKTVLKSRHFIFEEAVLKETDNHNERTEAFSYNINIDIYSDRDSFTCAKLLAFNTRWDRKETNIDHITTPRHWRPGPHDAKWLLNEYYTNQVLSNVNKWTVDFKNRIEECLQNSIEACASAINYMADAWTTKECKDCQPSDKAPTPYNRLHRVTAIFVSALLFVGIATAELAHILIAVIPPLAKKSGI